MYRRISLTAVTVVLLFAGISSAETPNRVTILYDSFGKAPALTLDWGFAALVEYDGKRILFDTGNNARIFEHNVKALGVDLQKIDAQRLYVVFEDPGVVAGVEQDAFAIVFDQGRKTPIQG